MTRTETNTSRTETNTSRTETNTSRTETNTSRTEKSTRFNRRHLNQPRSAFTMVEIIITMVILSAVSLMIADMMITENKQIVALSEDLQVNAQARQIFTTISRDIRSATRIIPEGDNVIQDADPDPGFVSEQRGSLRLHYKTPAIESANGSFVEWGIHYWLAGPATNVHEGIPRARSYATEGGEKFIYPLIRTVFKGTDPSDRSKILDEKAIGWVRGIIFYQRRQEIVASNPGADQTVVELPPTVHVKLTMSAFRNMRGRWSETYRETLATQVTSRTMVSQAQSVRIPLPN